MSNPRFRTTTNPDYERLQVLLHQGADDRHLHAIDMPYRLTSTWQDSGCEIGLWEKNSKLIAWAVFQPPWFNVDYVMHPLAQGTPLEMEIFAWGKEQMRQYANRTGYKFFGSFEFADNTPQAAQTKANLIAQGFQPFSWSIRQFQLDLEQMLPLPQLSGEFRIRPLRGQAEVQAYVDLHRAAFESDNMIQSWRQRILTHPHYKPALDLVAVNPKDEPVGFCICWAWQNIGHLEPLGVHPHYQGQGLGKALERTAVHLLRDHGCRTVRIDHVSSNERAIGLSQQTGFKPYRNALRYYVQIVPD